MIILLTNDDGIHCEGITALRDELSPNHEVWIMAPETERSGTSHSMSLKTPCKIKRIKEKEFTCSGMPADCIILSHLGLLPVKPDLVISGINKGPNLGTDIIFSGTAGGARQASLLGWKGIAVSLVSYNEPYYFKNAAKFISKNLQDLIDLWSPDVFININIPNNENKEYSWKFAEPSFRMYHDVLKSFTAPDSYTYCFLTDGKVANTNIKNHHDSEIVDSGFVAVSRIVVQPVTDNPKENNAK